MKEPSSFVIWPEWGFVIVITEHDVINGERRESQTSTHHVRGLVWCCAVLSSDFNAVINAFALGFCLVRPQQWSSAECDFPWDAGRPSGVLYSSELCTWWQEAFFKVLYCSAEVGEGDKERERDGGELANVVSGWGLHLYILKHIWGAVEDAMSMLNWCM